MNTTNYDEQSKWLNNTADLKQLAQQLNALSQQKQPGDNVPEVSNVNSQLPGSTEVQFPQTIRVMHINNRIRIRIFQEETIEVLLSKLIMFFDLGNKKPSDFGLMKRTVTGKSGTAAIGLLSFITNIGELQNDELYYVYYKASTDFTYIKDDEVDLFPPMHEFSDTKYNKVLRNGLTLGQVVQKIRRPKEELQILYCPFEKCLKEFSETGNLKTHIRTHTGERPYACSLCRESFVTKGHLQAHELTHTGQKPFTCKYQGCTKRYSRAGRLKIHYQTCHEIEKGQLDASDSDQDSSKEASPARFQCDLCKEKMTNSNSYLIHMQNHIMAKLQNKSSTIWQTNPKRIKTEIEVKPEPPILTKRPPQASVQELEIDVRAELPVNNKIQNVGQNIPLEREQQELEQDFQQQSSLQPLIITSDPADNLDHNDEQNNPARWGPSKVPATQLDIVSQDSSYTVEFFNFGSYFEAIQHGENTCKQKQDRPQVPNLMNLLQSTQNQGLSLKQFLSAAIQGAEKTEIPTNDHIQ